MLFVEPTGFCKPIVPNVKDTSPFRVRFRDGDDAFSKEEKRTKSVRYSSKYSSQTSAMLGCAVEGRASRSVCDVTIQNSSTTFTGGANIVAGYRGDNGTESIESRNAAGSSNMKVASGGKKTAMGALDSRRVKRASTRASIGSTARYAEEALYCHVYQNR